MLRPERSVEQSTTGDVQSMRRTTLNSSIEEVIDPSTAFMTTVQSPAAHHYDHILPKSVIGGPSSSALKNNNARTTVNFFRSVHNTSGNVFPGSGSRDSGRGLGGGWNGVVVEEMPQRDSSTGNRLAEIPGLKYLQVKVSQPQ